MRILISNDDGVYGSGMIPLIKALRPIGEVVVIVPDGEKSAASHCITLHKPFRVRTVQISMGGKEYFPVHITNGTPADCVRFGLLKVLRNKKVDLVVGGINQGLNLGDDTVYSGTVALAREAAMHNIPSFAISVKENKVKTFEAAARVAARIAREVLSHKLPPRTFLNVNVPSPSGRKDPQIKVARLGRRVYGKTITSRVDPRGEEYHWLAGEEPRGIAEKGTDIEAYESGKVSVTPLTPDATSDAFLANLAGWSFKENGKGR